MVIRAWGKSIAVVFSLAVCSLLSACSSSSKVYTETPYEGLGGSDSYSLREISENPQDFRGHYDIFVRSYDQKNYGISLFALSEMKRLSPKNLYVDYNMGIVLANLGSYSAAKSKIQFVQVKSENALLLNRCASSIIRIEGKNSFGKEHITHF